MTTLLVDIGNTRLKWRLLPARDSSQGSYAYLDGALEEYLEKCLSKLWQHTPDEVVVASVSRSQFTNTVIDWVKSRLGVNCRVLFAESFKDGLVSGYKQPQQLGVDRWLAMVGALRICNPPFVVCDVGSAITLDYVNSDKRHLGGIIAPGMDMMARSIYNSTGIDEYGIFAEIDDTQYRASTTRQGITLGIYGAAVALIEKGLQAFEDDIGMQAKLLMTGGGSPVLAGLLQCHCELIPDLVFMGMESYIPPK